MVSNSLDIDFIHGDFHDRSCKNQELLMHSSYFYIQLSCLIDQYHGHFVDITELRSNEGNKPQNNTRVSAETVRCENTYITLFLTWHNDSINDDKNDDLHTSSPCLTRSVFVLLVTSQSIVDDVTMTRQL